jgi:hypothetical protein
MRPAATLPWATLTTAILITGCLPEEPVWLPNGAGLVYVKPGEKDAELKHLDLENDRQRVIATISNCVTSPPAVSPQGDKVAVLQQSGDEMARIVVFDLSGQVTHRSAPFAQDTDEKWNTLTWSPFGERLLLIAEQPLLYSLDKRELLPLDKCKPSLLFLIYRVSPFVPDGSGLLLESEGDTVGGDDQNLKLMSWDGELHQIKPAAELDKLKDANLNLESFWPPPGTWQGNQLRLEVGLGYVVIDVERRQMRLEEDPVVVQRWKQAKDEQWLTTSTFAGGQARVVVSRTAENNVLRVDLRATPQSEAKVLLERAYAGYRDKSQLISLYPSSDGRYLAIKYSREMKGPPRILVIDRQGKTVRDDAL